MLTVEYINKKISSLYNNSNSITAIIRYTPNPLNKEI